MKFTPEDRRLLNVPVIVVLALALCGVAGLCTALYLRESNSIEQRLRYREAIRVNLLAHVFENDLQTVADTLRLLADGDGLRDYLAGGRPTDLERIARRATFVSHQQPNYDQVRFLDDRGLEVVRINQGGKRVPDTQLQDKADRTYFRDALTLKPGRIFVSAFDLNIENGRIEEPPRPMLRFSTPVFDRQGRRRGVYVLNYLGQDLLERLRDAAPELQQRFRVLNPQGYWIKAADASMEWGFMRSETAGHTLANTNPELWQQMTLKPIGQTRHAGGLFTWQRVEASSLDRSWPDGVIAEDAFWIVASEMSEGEWEQLFDGLRHTLLVVASVLAGLACSSVWFFRTRQRAARALRRSEENLSVTLNSIGDAVLATDTAGRITRINRVAEQLTGWTHDDALGRPIGEVFRIIHETTREPAVIPIDEVLVTGAIHGLANHTALIARDGTEHAIADSAAPILGSRGGILGVVLVFRDVRREREWEEAQARFVAIIESSNDVILSTTLDGRINTWNRAAERLFGYTAAEAIGQPSSLLLPPRHHDESQSPEQSGGDYPISHHDAIRVSKDGAQLNVSVALFPIKNAAGGVVGGAQIIRDVTERRQREARILQLNEELGLQASQLAAANTELESFSYSVSHDLRAPLRHVQGYVEMLLRETQGDLSEKAQRYLRTIASAGREMGELIDDLLSFSRMGRAELREAEIELNPLIKDCLRVLEPGMSNRHIRWEIATLPPVQGDREMIRQVFVNLLGNAIKYTRPRDPAEIAVGCAGEEDGRIIFFVRDNGAGFDMKYADKLFGVFQRLHRSDEFEGTGIGLANVRRIILRHGGRTWAEGRVNVGAVFYFTLKTAASVSDSSHPS